MRHAIRTACAAVAVALLATSCANGSAGKHPAGSGDVVYHPDYPSYTSAKEMFAKASLVVEGLVTGQPRAVKILPEAPADVTDPRQNPQAGAPTQAGAAEAEPVVVTVRTVQVVRVFKGDAKPGQSIEVKELGGRLDGVTYKEAEATPLQQDKTYALFLEIYPSSPASLLNSQQAKYLTDATSDALLPMPGNKVTLDRTDLEKLQNAR